MQKKDSTEALLVAAGVTLAGSAAQGIKTLLHRNKITICQHCKNEFKWKEMAEWGYVKKAINNSAHPEEVLAHWYHEKIQENAICRSCFEKEFAAIEKRLSKASSVHVYPSTYKGRLSIKSNSSIMIFTEEYRDREYAKQVLQAWAAYYGKNVITEARYDYSTHRNDNYYYKMWSYRGTASLLQ